MAKTVILVDDSRTILASAELALEDIIQAGQIHFLTYSNPQQFLDEVFAGSVDYDLLISDINMPQVSGLEVSARLKQDPRFKSKPILILTTESSAEMKEKGKAIGVTGWMVKPFSDEKLVKSIKLVLGL
ncbi:response regulator [Desulfurispirillum indicum]|uniref:Response regulator receiver n=1 Tax=Desulfurispirillum indicum (strain ATCC BAA-1389 / DSM 22839 / S5) TaxID=653733 RepID=E6W0A8_DESIS|nr:response regulator [Desulfurispirillum indicum]ADU66326.1 response regulator receiver [Desulfurispirillum indicum S5]UCZ55660.1 response regulator [Desulfurispirillum indicum]